MVDAAALAPWWERWPDWWAAQQAQVRKRWGKGTGFALDPATHSATWTGVVRLDDGSRQQARIDWGPATPFFAPRISFPGCLSAVHQLNDGSACLLSPVDPVNGWEGVVDIDYWMARGEEWLTRFHAEGWALPGESWAFYRLLLPGYRYRQALAATRMVALPPAWRDVEEGFGRVRVRVPRGTGLGAVIAWQDRLGADEGWNAGEALVAGDFDELDGIWARFSRRGFMTLKAPSAQRRFDRLLRDDWADAATAGRERIVLFSMVGAEAAQPASWTYLRFASPGVALGADPLQQMLALWGAPIDHGLGVALHPEDLDARRRAGRSDDMHEAIRETQVVLAGLGSLGSEVAHLLAQEGFRNFFLVDGDIFLPGNEARHRAGLVHAGRPKVDVVADLIRHVQPEASVQTHQGWIDELAPSMTQSEAGGPTPILVGVTGDEATEHFLGDVAAYLQVPVIHGWLEADGRVLRAMRTLPEGDPTISGVLRDGLAPVIPRSVAEDAPAVCADTVLPGSAMAIHAAANFLVRVVIDVVSGRRDSVNHWLFAPGGLDEATAPRELKSPYGVLGVAVPRR